MEIINKVLDMIAKWEPAGQGIFFVLMFAIFASAPVSLVLGIIKYFVIFFRGWPPPAPPAPPAQ